jgi:hypothetical protein
MDKAHSWLGSPAGASWRSLLLAVAANTLAVTHLVLNPSTSMLRLVMPLG